jgi:hypothetical protein
VAVGTLLVNGTHSGGGVYSISSGATLGGSGNISASVSVAPGGVLSPGSSIEELDITGTVDIDGILKIEVSPLGTGWIDELNVAGVLDISQATVDFDALGTLNDPDYVFAHYTSLSGTRFRSVIDLPSGYSIDYNYQGHNQIALVIPEPATLGLLALGGLALRRRRW